MLVLYFLSLIFILSIHWPISQLIVNYLRKKECDNRIAAHITFLSYIILFLSPWIITMALIYLTWIENKFTFMDCILRLLSLPMLVIIPSIVFHRIDSNVSGVIIEILRSDK